MTARMGIYGAETPIPRRPRQERPLISCVCPDRLRRRIARNARPGREMVRIPSVKAVWTSPEGFGDIGVECDTMIVSTKR
jgi:hypothetical protein